MPSPFVAAAFPFAFFFFFFLMEDVVGGRVRISAPVSVILPSSVDYAGEKKLDLTVSSPRTAQISVRRALLLSNRPSSDL